MYNEKKLALLDAALQNGAVDWNYNCLDERLDAFYPENGNYPQKTEYVVGYFEDGNWVMAKDYWPDGEITTDWARLFQV